MRKCVLFYKKNKLKKTLNYFFKINTKIKNMLKYVFLFRKKKLLTRLKKFIYDHIYFVYDHIWWSIFVYTRKMNLHFHIWTNMVILYFIWSFIYVHTFHIFCNFLRKFCILKTSFNKNLI